MHVFRKPALWILPPLLGLFEIFLVARADAQQPTPIPTSAESPQDLAKSVHNPFEDFVKLPLTSTTGFSIGPYHKAGEGFSAEPVFPFRLSGDWDLIVRPNFSLAYLPSPHEQTGLEDSQASFYLTPHQADVWLWGVGPIFQFPTASSTDLGTGKWAAGPTAALIYSKGPWFNGILVYQLMSFAGNRQRGSVNQTYLEPQVSYNFDSGWYVDTDPSITFDWTADSSNAWTLPAGVDVGKAFNLGSHAISLQVGPYYLVKRPNGIPQWIIRVEFTLLFPTTSPR